MKRKKLFRVLCICLSCLILLGVCGTVFYHGEWWYPALWQATHRGAIALTEASDEFSCRTWTLDELREAGAIESCCMMLIKSTHPIPEAYVPLLVEYNGARMHPLKQEPYIALRDTVQQKTGVRIYVASDYRTPEEQKELLDASGDDIAAAVGCSEHEAGLALDVYAPYFGGENFLRSRAGRRVNDTCAEYGYIIRYPKGKEAITGIAYEPWHLRYVGAPHARIISDAGLTLEEYLDLLTPDVRYESGDYLILRCKSDAILLPQGWRSCEISPDNTGYYIITLQMR